MTQQRILAGHWDHTDWPQEQLLDGQEPGEFSQEYVPGAINMPLSQLRDLLTDLPSHQPIYIYCEVGQRAYYATRAQAQWLRCVQPDWWL